MELCSSIFQSVFIYSVITENLNGKSIFCLLPIYTKVGLFSPGSDARLFKKKKKSLASEPRSAETGGPLEAFPLRPPNLAASACASHALIRPPALRLVPATA